MSPKKINCIPAIRNIADNIKIDELLAVET